MHAVLAPDKFKGSLSAASVADALAAGIRRTRPDLELRRVPIADGGEGTLDAVLAAGYRRHEITVSGPTGEPVRTAIAMSERTAVVELADASGLGRLPGGILEPLRANSYGVGELIGYALDLGADTVVLAVGGSACTDGGAGMLAALGARLLDGSGRTVRAGGGTLASIVSLDVSDVDSRLAGRRIVLAADVDNPLLGEHGAARVYGPQKGADPAMVERLEVGMRSWAGLVAGSVGRDLSMAEGGGAAGGVGFAALAALGAELNSGIGTILELVDLPNQLEDATLVVTGEGSLDSQSLRGKAPVGVARAAARAGVPVIAVAGRCLLSPEEYGAAGLRAVYSLTALEPDPARSMAHAASLLGAVGGSIAEQWLTG
jgi:glycerate kinase